MRFMRTVCLKTLSPAACAPLYTTAMAQGLSQHDTASVCEVLGRMAGLQGGTGR